MTKHELAHIAKVMYDLQEECKRHKYKCIGCYGEHHPSQSNWCNFSSNMLPCEWGITKADIERLKRIEGELGAKVPVEWLKSAVQANKELGRENNESN